MLVNYICIFRHFSSITLEKLNPKAAKTVVSLYMTSKIVSNLYMSQAFTLVCFSFINTYYCHIFYFH